MVLLFFKDYILFFFLFFFYVLSFLSHRSVKPFSWVLIVYVTKIQVFGGTPVLSKIATLLGNFSNFTPLKLVVDCYIMIDSS